MTTGLQNILFVFVALSLVGFFPVEAANRKHKNSPTKHDVGLALNAVDTEVDKADESVVDSDENTDASSDFVQAGPNMEEKGVSSPGGSSSEKQDDEEKPKVYEVKGVAPNTDKETETEDKDDDDNDDDEEEPVPSPARTAEEARVAKAELKLAENLREQSELQSKLKHLGDEAKSNAEIDASVKLVANETESVAMAEMLGHVWKEMRMFETPFYEEHVEEELQHLKKNEHALEEKVTVAQKAVSVAKDEKVKQKLAASSEKEAKKNQDEQEDQDEPKKTQVDQDESKSAKKTKAGPEAGKGDGIPTDTDAVVSSMSFWAMGSSQKMSFLLNSLIYLVGGILVAYLFQEAAKRYPTVFVPQPSRDKYPNSKDFSNHIFGFLGDRNMCILGCFCPCLTWAATLDRKGLLSYWRAFMSFFLLMLLHAYTMGVSTLCVAILGVFYRQKLRASYDIENGTLPTVAMDFLLWCCCQPCAIIQEAREESVTHGSAVEGP